MKGKTFIKSCAVSYSISRSTNKKDYKFWNPSSASTVVVENQAWRHEVKNCKKYFSIAKRFS